MPEFDKDKLAGVSGGFKGSTGFPGLKKLFGMEQKDPMREAIQKRIAKLTPEQEPKPDVE